MDEEQLSRAEALISKKKKQISQKLLRLNKIYMVLYHKKEKLQKQRLELQKQRTKVRRSKRTSAADAARVRQANKKPGKELIDEFTKAEEENRRRMEGDS